MNGLLLCRSGFDAGLAHRAKGPSALIGRALDCPIQVVDDALSRHHAQLIERAGGVLIEDIDSSLGTEVNGARIVPGKPVALAHLDVIRLGGMIELVWIDLARVPLTEILAASLVGPGGERVPLRVGNNSIGSHEDCDLIVPDPSVSARHAVLTLSPRGVLVRADGESLLRVNGDTEVEAELASGDVLELSATAEFHIETFSGTAPVPPPIEESLIATATSADDAAAAADDDVPEKAYSTQEVRVAPPSPPVVAAEAVPDPADTARAPVTAPVPWPVDLPTHEDDDEGMLDAGDTAALSIADLEEALREARERQQALAEEAALEDTDSGRVAEIHSQTVDLGTSVRRPKVDVPPGTGPKDFKAVRREVAYRVSVRVPDGETRVTLLREGRHVLGRSEACRVVVPHPSVSREHAEIHVSPQGVRLRDLASSNGTFRGEQRVADLTIIPGEVIAFGDAQATFEEL